MRICFVCLCLFFSANTTYSATNTILVKGIVLYEKPIPDVVISRNWEKTKTLSQEDGTFYLYCQKKDTLIFKHLSFEPKAIALSEIKNTDSLVVILTPRTEKLGEVTITNWGTWQQFKQKIMNKSIDSINNTPENRLSAIFPGHSHPIKNPYFRNLKRTRLSPLNIIGKGIIGGDIVMMLYSNLSKEQKYRREFAANILRTQKITKNAYRYSSELLEKQLHITGDTLKLFKEYCDRKIDLSKNEYELVNQINSLYKDWQESGGISLRTP